MTEWEADEVVFIFELDYFIRLIGTASCQERIFSNCSKHQTDTGYHLSDKAK